MSRQWRTLVVTFLLTACATPASPVRFVTPAGSGSVTLAVVELGEGEFVNLLDGGTVQSPDGRQTLYRGGSLWEYRARIVRIMAGPALASRVRVRRTGLDTGPRVSRGRWLAFLEQTSGGHLHDQWDVQVERGRACLPAYVVSRFQLVARGSRLNGQGETCLYV